MVAALVAAVTASGSSLASAPSLHVRASLTPTGCRQALAGSVVTLRGCVAAGQARGTASGQVTLRYDARVDLASGRGAQSGTLELALPKGHGSLVAAFTGNVTVAGTSAGSWTATRRTGAMRRLTARSGSYTTTTPDQGVHLTLDVRG